MAEYKDTWYEELTGMVRETAAYEAPGSCGQYTIEDYFRLPYGDRKELIDGVFYDMASPDSIHQFLVAEIYRFCDQVPMGIFGGECKVDFGKITSRMQFL